ncbi:MAG: lipid-A-disaccharide synthase [Gammaproteobacteria bacterium]|mgnify:FL=1|nr:lipid-A-disaccharide synthase [Gammaproteobacteria bacterium]MDC0485103.1 lipid-A-disaccharide synthase [Gammaproteobacteria bacterium]
MSKEKIKIGIIAAEHSGDRLGAKLIESLKAVYEVELFGLAGPEVSAHSIFTPSTMNYQDLHVMGLIDPLLNLPKLLSLRKRLLNLFVAKDIDIFVGVDSPDFNMFFHKRLGQKQIKTVQVVSPSVWGWRENRIKDIESHVDLTMCLFKFECNFYASKNMNSFFLGHPFSKLQMGDKNAILSKHGLEDSKDFVSILPGSRRSEISQLMPIYIQSAKKLLEVNPNIFFLIPAANSELADAIASHQDINQIPHSLATEAAQDFLSISTISIVTSGTASLEAAVLGSVPIICYKTNAFNYAILSRMVKTPFIGLPNLLLQEHVFPELIQQDLSVDAIVSSYSEISSKPQRYQSHLAAMNDSMNGEGFTAAAQAIKHLL